MERQGHGGRRAGHGNLWRDLQGAMSSKAVPGIRYQPRGSTHSDPFPSTRPHLPELHQRPMTSLPFDWIASLYKLPHRGAMHSEFPRCFSGQSSWHPGITITNPAHKKLSATHLADCKHQKYPNKYCLAFNMCVSHCLGNRTILICVVGRCKTAHAKRDRTICLSCVCFLIQKLH